MNILKTLGLSTALVALVAVGGQAALANGDESSKSRSFLKEPTVVIGGQGNVLVRGAEVSAVSDDTITAKTVWSGTTLTWTVDTDNDTEFFASGKDTQKLADIDVGDIISFAGDIAGSLRVSAHAVREWPDETTQNDDGKNHDKGNDNGKDWKRPFISFWHSVSAHFGK